jgi:hypothetical protein
VLAYDNPAIEKPYIFSKNDIYNNPQFQENFINAISHIVINIGQSKFISGEVFFSRNIPLLADPNLINKDNFYVTKIIYPELM